MRQSINPYTLANDARMRRASFKGTFLYVEGVSDEKLYGIFVNHDLCQLIIAHSRENALRAIEMLHDSGFVGAVGMVDADFDHLEHKAPLIPVIFITDLHDAECLMLFSAAFDKLLFQFASKAKIEKWRETHNPDIRQHILSQAALLGCLVWHSIRNGLNLKFEGLDTKEFTCTETLEIDAVRLVQHVKNKSQRHDLSEQELLTGVHERAAAVGDLWQVVRGHDFIDLLSFALRQTLGNWSAHEVMRERLELDLRMAYSRTDFFSTHIYASVSEWERNNEPFQIFQRD